MRFHRDYHLHPRVLLKLAICRLRLADTFGLVEYCHRCGCRVRDVWWAPQSLWNDVIGTGEAGVRCIHCFDVECRARGILLQWRPSPLHQQDARGRWVDVSTPPKETT